MTTLRGRVLHAASNHLVLLVPGGLRRDAPLDEGAPPVHPGDLVEVADGRSRVIARHPTGDYPRPETEEGRFTAPDRWDRLRRRADLLRRTRAFFHERGFLEVETPTVVPCPGTEVHMEPTMVRQRRGEGLPVETRFLITSPEHHMKRLLAGGAPPIVQIGRVYRDGERGQHHRPEFTMVEWYRPWEEPESVMEDCEGWLLALAEGSSLSYQGTTLDLSPPWPRIRFLQALAERGGIIEPERLTPEEQLRALVEHVEPTLGRERPEFLTHYPITMASLARTNADDPEVADRFELYAGGLELGNGFGELTDPHEQRRRFESDNTKREATGQKTIPIDEAFLAALESGMPPSSGIAVGFDRIAMLLCDVADIDDVLAFEEP